jgi:hypothetical protein
MQPSPQPVPSAPLPQPPLQPETPPPIGDPRSLVPYLETFQAVVEGGTNAQVFTFWVRTLRIELETITDECSRAEAKKLLQEIDKVGHWYSHEAKRPGEALALILSPIRKLTEYLSQPPPPK